MSDFFIEKTESTAREAHRCEWCGEGIHIGELYVFQSTCFNGQFHATRWHRKCWAGADTVDLDDAFRIKGGKRVAAN